MFHMLNKFIISWISTRMILCVLFLLALFAVYSLCYFSCPSAQSSAICFSSSWPCSFFTALMLCFCHVLCAQATTWDANSFTKFIFSKELYLATCSTSSTSIFPITKICCIILRYGLIHKIMKKYWILIDVIFCVVSV